MVNSLNVVDCICHKDDFTLRTIGSNKLDKSEISLSLTNNCLRTGAKYLNNHGW